MLPVLDKHPRTVCTVCCEFELSAFGVAEFPEPVLCPASAPETRRRATFKAATVDERDGNGRANGNNAKVKQLFKIDLDGAVDVSAMDGLTAATHSVAKTLFLDIVQVLTANGIAAGNIPAKMEGVAFGPDVRSGKKTIHTLWMANDNDFLQTVPDATGNLIPNPNQFFVFGFTDADLAGSKFVPQEFREFRW